MHYDKIKLDLYSANEEVANAITHLLGVALGMTGTVLLLIGTGAGEALKQVSFLIYGGSMIILYSASSIYHLVRTKKRKYYFKILDHCAIYLLIAGTFTPFAVGVLWEERLGPIILAVVWGIALLGIIFKLFFTGRFEYLSLASYLGMGWLGFTMFSRLGELLSGEAVNLLLYGGLCYTGGVVFYVWRKLPYHHAIWHLFVLGGSIFHFLSIYQYVLPYAL